MVEMPLSTNKLHRSRTIDIKWPRMSVTYLLPPLPSPASGCHSLPRRSEVTQNLAIFLSDPIHVVGQEPEVGINCSHVCVRAPLRLAFEVDCNIVDFQPHGPTPQTLYLPSCSVISSLTALGPQTSSYPEIGPPLPYLMYCLLHSSVISFSNTRLRNWWILQRPDSEYDHRFGMRPPIRDKTRR